MSNLQLSKAKFSFVFFVLLLFVAANLHAAPFFDQDPETALAPTFPGLSELDKEILALCGDWGNHVAKTRFESFVRKHARSSWFTPIKKRVEEEKGAEFDPVSFFSSLWLSKDGFAHVFCGEPGSKRLGGLHYFPRYWQAQQKNWAWLADKGDRRLQRYCSARTASTNGEIYTVPVVWITSRSKERVKCLSSYHLEMNADEIFLAATIASLGVKSNSNKYVCIEKVEAGDGYSEHHSLLVLSKGSLITWYPITVKQYQKKKNNGVALC